MPVCKYFQTNSCKFGSRCRNSHVYEEREDTYNQQRKPSGVSVLQRNKQVVNAPTNFDNQYGHQQDINRQVNPSGTVWFAGGNHYQQGYGNISQPRYPGYGPSPFHPPATPTPAATRYFYSNPQNTNPTQGFFTSTPQNISSGFSLGSHPAFRGQSAAFNTNIFGQALSEVSSFNASDGSVFMPDPYAQTSQPMIVHKVPVFGQPMEDKNAFNQNVFGSTVQSKPVDNSITAAKASQSSSQYGISNMNNEPSVAKANGNLFLYSNPTDLTPEELEHFKATTFIYGCTPLRPPPKELC